MNTRVVRMAAVLALAAMLIGSAMAQGKGKTPPAKGRDCPVCHMPLMTKRDAGHPVAVQFNRGGKVMYCCPACKMPASMIVKPKAGKGTGHKHEHRKGHKSEHKGHEKAKGDHDKDK